METSDMETGFCGKCGNYSDFPETDWREVPMCVVCGSEDITRISSTAYAYSRIAFLRKEMSAKLGRPVTEDEVFASLPRTDVGRGVTFIEITPTRE